MMSGTTALASSATDDFPLGGNTPRFQVGAVLVARVFPNLVAGGAFLSKKDCSPDLPSWHSTFIYHESSSV